MQLHEESSNKNFSRHGRQRFQFDMGYRGIGLVRKGKKGKKKRVTIQE